MVDLLCCIPGSICCYFNKDQDSAEKHTQDTKPKIMEAKEELNSSSRIMNRFKQYKSPVTALVVTFYSPFLQNYIVKTVVIIIFSIWFGFTVWGCTKVEDGLDADDALLPGTVEHSFASANIRHFAAYGFTVISKDIDYPNPEIQETLLQLSEEIIEQRYVVLAGGFTDYWLSSAILYYSGIEAFYKQVYCAQLLANATLEQQLQATYGDFLIFFTTVHTLVDRLNLNNSTLIGDLVRSCNSTLPPLVESIPNTNRSYIPSDKFYRFIALWVSAYI